MPEQDEAQGMYDALMRQHAHLERTAPVDLTTMRAQPEPTNQTQSDPMATNPDPIEPSTDAPEPHVHWYAPTSSTFGPYGPADRHYHACLCPVLPGLDCDDWVLLGNGVACDGATAPHRAVNLETGDLFEKETEDAH